MDFIRKLLLQITVLGLFTGHTLAQHKDFLPPQIPWQGASEQLIRPSMDPWCTTAERTNFDSTATLSDTYKFYEKLAQRYQSCRMDTIGASASGIPLVLVMLSQENDLLRSEKPTILLQSGIHAGEVDGKDAGMMWARDVLAANKYLDAVNVLIVPVLNVEGHERKSPFNRINQRGPLNMGWRTNGANLNLNRDFMKVETSGVKIVLELLNTYKPDLYVDVHVTDGADYQYDITYGFMGVYSPHIYEVLQEQLRPFVDEKMKKLGHIPGSLLFAKNGDTFENGNLDYNFNPDFSHAYGDATHVPSILVENHSLKTFKQRVLGTYAFFDALAVFMKNNPQVLNTATEEDIKMAHEKLPVQWVFTTHKEASSTNPWENEIKGAKAGQRTMHKGIEAKTLMSTISGGTYTSWSGKPADYDMDVYKNDIAAATISLPLAYIIPSYRKELIDKVMHHFIPFQLIERDTVIRAYRYKMKEPTFAKSPFEGRFKVKAEIADDLLVNSKVPAGSIMISQDQKKFLLAALLLEPQSSSSLFQWGYLSSIFNRTEYIEAYVIEPYMTKTLKSDPEKKRAFEEKMKNEKFAKNPQEIREWFYRHSPFVDSEYLQYPILRLK